jgi:hypothetical protein
MAGVRFDYGPGKSVKASASTRASEVADSRTFYATTMGAGTVVATGPRRLKPAKRSAVVLERQLDAGAKGDGLAVFDLHVEFRDFRDAQVA